MQSNPSYEDLVEYINRLSNIRLQLELALIKAQRESDDLKKQLEDSGTDQNSPE